MNKLSLNVAATLSLLAGSLVAEIEIAPSYTNADLGLPPEGSVNVAPQYNVNQTMPQASTANTTNPQNRAGAASNKYPPLTTEQRQQFVSQMNDQIQKAESLVQTLTNNATDQSKAPMSIDKVALESAIINLEVKKTLVEKFAASPSLNSPKVQQILMQVLQNTDIQPGDLAALQSVVNSERPYTYP